MKSALYEGTVWHERSEPAHRFGYRLFLVWLDLDELPEVFDGRWLWSARGPNAAWFRRADYLGPKELPLRDAVLARVEAQLGRRPQGAVRVLTHLRTFGYVFNPVTFYFCHDADERLDAVVAEITNTPWRERHAYVLDVREGQVGEGEGEELRWSFQKDFHVSPFFPMEHEYRWALSVPGDRLAVRMTNLAGGREVFRAGLELRRREITGRGLAGALLRHPLLTFRVHLAIYWQAARLWWKRAPFFAHPQHRGTSPVPADGGPAPHETSAS